MWAAWWILWRRIAAGLGEAEHAAIFAAIEPHLHPAPKGRVANPGKKAPGLASDDLLACIGDSDHTTTRRRFNHTCDYNRLRLPLR